MTLANWKRSLLKSKCMQRYSKLQLIRPLARMATLVPSTASWGVIKEDLLAAVNFFFNQHEQHFQHLNSAHLILIPKRSDAQQIGEYRPISLTHSVAKIVSKLLAIRLAPFLNQLVSRAQSAFIKKRSIHDNCLCTQNLVRDLHRLDTGTFPQVTHCQSI